MNVTLSGGAALAAGVGVRLPPLSLLQARSRVAASNGRRAARSRRAYGRCNLDLLLDAARRLMPEEDAPFGQGEDDVQRYAGEGEDADGGEQRGRGEGGVRHEDDQPQAAVARAPLGDDGANQGEGGGDLEGGEQVREGAGRGPRPA